jgi:hypothetical protein
VLLRPAHAIAGEINKRLAARQRAAALGELRQDALPHLAINKVDMYTAR